MSPVTRRRVSEAIAVRWTPDVAARVKRRLAGTIARRRRQVASLALALLLVAGVGFAFPAAREAWRRHVHPGATGGGRSATGPTSGTTTPAEAPPREAAAAPAPALEAPAVDGASTFARDIAGPPVRKDGPAAHPRRVAETATSLLAAADAARLAGRPADAVAPLSALCRRFPTDPRAPIAAFQLGRVLADELDDPAAAARAFERARELDPRGPLAIDAAARAAEARAAATGRGSR